MKVRLGFVLRVLGTLGGLAYIASQVDLRLAGQALARIPVAVFLLASVLVATNVVVGAMRWGVLMQAYGATAIPPLEQFLDLNLLVSSGTIQAGQTYDGSQGVLEAYVRSYGSACGGAQFGNLVAKNDGILARSVTITEISATRLAGTFTIRMYDPMQQQGDVTGAFDVPLCTNAGINCMP